MRCPRTWTAWYNPAMKPVVLVDYDDQWPIQFEAIAQVFRTVCGSSVKAIHHVGSTAVLGLCAKAILDIDLEIDAKAFETVKARLETLGYTHEGDLGIAGREAFKNPKSPFPKHHLYVCASDNAELKRHLAFRDALRRDTTLRDTYARTKREAAMHHPLDMEAYINEKGIWINQVICDLGSNLAINPRNERDILETVRLKENDHDEF
jgi:GrpB-like predicted nucleotidyltransferase (UPF0157 family)